VILTTWAMALEGKFGKNPCCNASFLWPDLKKDRGHMKNYRWKLKFFFNKQLFYREE